jgi:hypothetical protein
VNYYTKDDQVAVILHREYGLGWWTWHGDDRWLVHPELAEAIDTGRVEVAQDLIDEFSCQSESYHPGQIKASNLEVFWADRHRKFLIENYDGCETLVYRDEIKWLQF